MISTQMTYDFAVIGGGIVGAAIARELAGTESTVALIEARNDVGDGTSKANTAILHTGFDATPGTLESRLVTRGCKLLRKYARVTGIPVERTGALLVAWTDEELNALPGLKDKAAKNGYHDAEVVGSDEVYRQVPDLGRRALGALSVPDESIICTWTTNLALATEAVARGTKLLRSHRVTGILVGEDSATIATTAGELRARWIINAAGLGADQIDAMLGFARFEVTPRRGELFVFDKLARPLVPKIVLPVPSAKGNLRERDAGPDGGRPRGSVGDRDLGGWIRVPPHEGHAADAATLGRGGHGHIRRTPCCDRQQGLPDRHRRHAALRACCGHPFDRTHLRNGDR